MAKPAKPSPDATKEVLRALAKTLPKSLEKELRKLGSGKLDLTKAKGLGERIEAWHRKNASVFENALLRIDPATLADSHLAAIINGFCARMEMSKLAGDEERLVSKILREAAVRLMGDH
jgi:hypothetical protein